MALISRGSIDDFDATIAPDVAQKFEGVRGLRTISAVGQATRDVQPAPMKFPASKERRGLALDSLRLLKGFEGLIGNVFNSKNEVFFLSWAWDLSGERPFEHPGAGANPEKFIIPMKSGELREFIGAGVELFPARKVTSGLAIRIQIWESDKDARAAGKTVEDVAKAIEESELNNLLTLIGTVGGATTATVTLVKDAGIELAKVIGTILKANSNDYVDFFEGYYPASDPWVTDQETYKSPITEIVLSRFS